MKKSLYVTGSLVLLCVFGTACSHKIQNTASGTKQIQAPVAPPTQTAPPVQQAKAAPSAGQTGLGTTAQPAASAKKLSPQQRTELNQLLARMSDAFFDYNQADIRTDATTALTQDVTVIRNILADYPAEKLLIEGHADERGSAEYNLLLADRRSRAAQEFLSSRGIPQSQLSVLSYGEERPVCREQTEACYQQNRRVHITVAP
jgi:peptidoglycan-associated lipoprotein